MRLALRCGAEVFATAGSPAKRELLRTLGVAHVFDSRSLEFATAIRDLTGGELNKISVEIIAQAASENDSLAFRVLQDAASNIAVGLADLVNLLNPRLIIFGERAGNLPADPEQLHDRRRMMSACIIIKTLMRAVTPETASP